MRWVIIIIIALSIFYFISHPAEITEKDIRSSNIPIDEQRHSLLLYEKRMVCEGHSPAFYAVVDGAMEKDPSNALAKCREGLRVLETVSLPANLPARVRKALGQAQALLKKDLEDNIKIVENHIAVKEGRPMPHPIVYPRGFTCKAFSIIQKVNMVYDVDKMMNGQYVNCEVLSRIEGG